MLGEGLETDDFRGAVLGFDLDLEPRAARRLVILERRAEICWFKAMTWLSSDLSCASTQ